MGRLISDVDKNLFNTVNAELIELVGTTVKIWSLKREIVDDNPVYQEPEKKWTYLGPYEVIGFVTKPERLFEALDRGMGVETDLVLTLSKKLIDNANIPEPKIGDIVEFWDGKFDVIKVSRDGFLDDTATFVQWVIDLKRRRAYLPERKGL